MVVTEPIGTFVHTNGVRVAVPWGGTVVSIPGWLVRSSWPSKVKNPPVKRTATPAVSVKKTCHCQTNLAVPHWLGSGLGVGVTVVVAAALTVANPCVSGMVTWNGVLLLVLL